MVAPGPLVVWACLLALFSLLALFQHIWQVNLYMVNLRVKLNAITPCLLARFVMLLPGSVAWSLLVLVTHARLNAAVRASGSSRQPV